jgi:hypothetical protein
MKWCSSCKKEKYFEDFNKSAKAHDGVVEKRWDDFVNYINKYKEKV